MRSENPYKAYALIAPAFLLFLIFSAYPLIWSLYISFTSWDGLNPVKEYIGFDNYGLLFGDHEFIVSIKVTLIYVFFVTILSSILGFIVALNLQKIKFSRFYRTLYFSPVVTATVAAGVVWKLIFDPFSGVINKSLGAFNITGPNWLSDTRFALPAVIIVGIWKRVGFAMVVFAAGLASLPTSTYEAAALDGADGIKAIRFITIPLLRPIFLVVFITGIIDSIQVFDHIFIMTNGGPMGSTQVLSMLLYNQGFKLFHLGTASAIGWLILFGVVSLGTVQRLLAKKAFNNA
ncbi:UgpA ABC-type sugar transport systems, permease components [Candidatus Nanopelagicaceae bacterium]